MIYSPALSLNRGVDVVDEPRRNLARDELVSLRVRVDAILIEGVLVAGLGGAVGGGDGRVAVLAFLDPRGDEGVEGLHFRRGLWHCDYPVDLFILSVIRCFGREIVQFLGQGYECMLRGAGTHDDLYIGVLGAESSENGIIGLDDVLRRGTGRDIVCTCFVSFAVCKPIGNFRSYPDEC